MAVPDPSGRLTEAERAEAARGHASREDMPADVFLEPGGRKYPVKTERDGAWHYDRDLLLAAAREARMHGHEALAARADEIRAREFGAAEDTLALDRSVRSMDEDGRLRVALTPISKATVNEYFGAEIPNSHDLGLDPQRKYKLLRHPDELKKAAETSNHVPVMIRHIKQSAADPQQDEIVGSTGTDAVFDKPHLKNSLVVWVKGAIDGINDNTRRQLSASYRYDADMTPGNYEGESYDGIMRNIRFNHVALVEEGRAGPDVLVEDSLPPALKEPTMRISRRALTAQGVLAGWLAPKLAADAKMPDLRAILAGATAANWQAAKPKIEARLAAALAGGLAMDAAPAEARKLLDNLDGEGKDQTEPDEMEVVDKRGRDRAKDDNLSGHEGTEETNEDRRARDARRAKDKVARDKAAKGWATDEEPETEAEMRARHEREARDNELGSSNKKVEDGGRDADPETEAEMKARQAREAKDAKRARDARAKDRPPARDAETEEERAAREKREREAEDARRASDRHATDAAITSAIAAERQRGIDIREAERAVRPWIGELALAQDSAEAVYRLALGTIGVDTKGVHPSALRHILEAQPKPGTTSGRPRLAQDAATGDAFAKRFPNLAAVRHY